MPNQHLRKLWFKFARRIRLLREEDPRQAVGTCGFPATNAGKGEDMSGRQVDGNALPAATLIGFPAGGRDAGIVGCSERDAGDNPKIYC